MDDYAHTDKDDSGDVDEMELREFIRKKRRDGVRTPRGSSRLP